MLPIILKRVDNVVTPELYKNSVSKTNLVIKNYKM